MDTVSIKSTCVGHNNRKVYLDPFHFSQFNVPLSPPESFRRIIRHKGGNMELLLNQGELLNMGENLAGLTIICRSGACWLTQTGDPRDHILRRGARFEVRSKGQLVLYAASSCSIQMVPQADTLLQPLLAEAAR